VSDPPSGTQRVAVNAPGASIGRVHSLKHPTNVGAIFRSAAAFGVDAVLVTPRCADPLYRRSIRVSMGTVFQVPWTRIESWPDGIRTLQEHGFRVAALALDDDSVGLREFAAAAPERTAVVFGTEGAGLRRSTI